MPVKFSAPLSARVETRHFSVVVHLVVPQVKRPTPQQRSQREALIAATTYRLAGELTAMNADVGASIALDLYPRDGLLTIEATEDQDINVVICLVGDALSALRIAIQR